MVKASPQAYRDQANGAMMEGENINALRNQFIGEEKGLRYLSALLTQSEKDFREKIKTDEEKQRQQ